MEEITKLIELSKYNHSLDIKRDQDIYLSLNWALNQIIDEVNEVKEELKPNNETFIEDELSDILWSFFMSIEKFKYSGYDIEHKSIIKRALKKYQERVLPLKGDIEIDREIWDRVKKEQKRRLEEEHRSKLCKRSC